MIIPEYELAIVSCENWRFKAQFGIPCWFTNNLGNKTNYYLNRDINRVEFNPDYFSNCYRVPKRTSLLILGQYEIMTFKRITSSMLLLMTLAVPDLGQVQAQEKSAPDDSSRSKTAPFFDQAHDALENALGLYDKQQKMPAEDDLAFYDYFSRTKESQQKRVDSYLDVAAEAFGISKITERRDKIAALRKMISDTRIKISEYKRNRISAPDSTYNPLGVSKKGYDKKIGRAETQIEQAEKEIAAEKQDLVKQLNRIGMPISDENVDVLLESITGDEFVRISIIFDNAKSFAAELERLTNESDEDLETAKKYYGVYLMLLNSVDRLQEKFIEKVDDEYIPQLDGYVAEANKIIAEARKAIKQGGDRQQLQNNIYNNEVTLEAASFYKRSLAKQKYEMQRANEKIKKNILTADNTYKTAALSKDIASLISTSRRAFDAITGLSVPDLRPFENTKLKAEFSRLAREIQGKRN